MTDYERSLLKKWTDVDVECARKLHELKASSEGHMLVDVDDKVMATVGRKWEYGA